MILLPNNHISLTCESIVQEICKPLFEKTVINYFIFARFFKDGTHFCLPSNAKWHQYFWEKGYNQMSFLRLKPGFHFWKLKNEFSQANIDALKMFNMDNKFDYIVETKKYFDVFGFATSPGQDEVVDFYLNHIEMLKKFTLYFKEQAKDLIKLASKKENLLFIERSKEIYIPGNKIKLPDFRLRKFEFGHVVLTEKEMTVLSLVMRGRSATDIAEFIHVSVKTAESYINAIKKKFNCSTREELFDTAYQMGIVDMIKQSIVDQQLIEAR